MRSLAAQSPAHVSINNYWIQLKLLLEHKLSTSTLKKQSLGRSHEEEALTED